MFEILKPALPDNPLVYFDIDIGQEYAGRMVIELRKDVVPKAAENFRCLCTGERGIGQLGKPLHYKGTRFHKVIKVYVAQGGDIVNNDGTSGESIYGPTFESENYFLKHDEGVVSMVNYGQPHTNNSQFVITSVVCDVFDETNVAIGKVLRGLGIIGEMEQNTSDEGKPTKEIRIVDCGEIMPGEDWGYHDTDGEDITPPYPQDWEGKNEILKPEAIVHLLTTIRKEGNNYFSKGDYYSARRKYRKGFRFYSFYRKKYECREPGYENKDELQILDGCNAINCVNMAAVEIKLGEYESAEYYCSEAISYDSTNSKAYYRRGQAHIYLKSYEKAIADLSLAKQLVPENKIILNELNRAKKLQAEYDRTTKEALKKLFK